MVLSEQLNENLNVDVVVIGSGIAGISAAYHLEKAGYDVAVLEEYEVASGATQYSSGILYFGSGTDFQTAVSLWGVAKAKLFFDESKNAIDEALALVKSNDWKVGLRSPGTIIVASNEADKNYLQREAQAMELLGYPGKLLSSEEVSSYYNGCKFAAGLFQPMCHQIKPSLFVPLLANSLKGAVYQNTPMLEIEETQSGVSVTTPSAVIEAKHVVIATNLKPTFGLEKHFFQEASVLLPSHELGDKLQSFWPTDVIMWTPDERYDLLYCHDGTAFLEMYDLQNVDEKVKKYFPSHVEFQRNKTIGDAWSKTKDWFPIVGSVNKNKNIHVSVAMGDQGIVMGFTSGKNIAKLINGETNNFLEMCNPARFLK
ncbi:MAG: FAD-dependent oxidoreductase [Candidatus Micrarchaeota archaeon]|nr:FAD-dependent oxidoreductase [Candidatus Micrarchaeota archaeon]